MSTDELLAEVDAAGDPAVADVLSRYFQLQPGGYGHGDRMIGVKLSTIRGILKPYLRADLPLAELEKALTSPVHEHRLTILCLLADRATRSLKPRTANPAELTAIHDLYLRGTAYINNWDLVDCSAPQIVGGYLLDKSRAELYTLVRSSSLWERRIALVATQFLIGQGQTTDTYKLSALVLDDREDLIHKASGWMLREAGKRVSEPELLAFLDEYAARMPRTMLRYAIERLAPETRAAYLAVRR
ncbi:DNA alkylation repair protein [Kribbella solani]|uniref:3-methyladenine DNA glycosylase AlkD n=1 Tax=Kribbella solani TaxID=236067 RepID=A0A841DRQ8_9ACTN|nr:3-methyladenine DNA glycosylase AlkD [Kribbella solani]